MTPPDTRMPTYRLPVQIHVLNPVWEASARLRAERAISYARGADPRPDEFSPLPAGKFLPWFRSLVPDPSAVHPSGVVTLRVDASRRDIGALVEGFDAAVALARDRRYLPVRDEERLAS